MPDLTRNWVVHGHRKHYKLNGIHKLPDSLVRADKVCPFQIFDKLHRSLEVFPVGDEQRREREWKRIRKQPESDSSVPGRVCVFLGHPALGLRIAGRRHSPRVPDVISAKEPSAFRFGMRMEAFDLHTTFRQSRVS